MKASVVGAVAVLVVSFILFSNINVGEAGHTPAAHSPTAPAPVSECLNVTMKMMDCLGFVINNSTLKKPNGTCCEGLKTVIKTDPYCICDGFKQSIQLGIQINMTQAITLPTVCHLSAPPSITKCGRIPGLALPPAVYPVAPSPSTTGAPTKTVPPPGSGTSTSTSTSTTPAAAPASAPGTSSSSTITFSGGLLLVAMVVSYFY